MSTNDLDWDDLTTRFIATSSELIRGDDFDGRACYTEALKRTIASAGLLTRAEHERILEVHQGANQTSLVEAQATIRELRAALAGGVNATRASLARALRQKVNERTIPSRYRREGAKLVLDWLDPEKP